MIDQTRVAATPPPSGPQTPSPATPKRDLAPRLFEATAEPAVASERPLGTPHEAIGDDSHVETKPEERQAYETPRHVTQGFMHEETGRYVIRVVASLRPDDVIAQYPPEDLLRFYELAKELQGQSAAPELARASAAV